MSALRHRLLSLALLGLTPAAILSPRQAGAMVPRDAFLPSPGPAEASRLHSAREAGVALSAESAQAPRCVLVAVERDGSFCAIFCRNDPVNNTDPLGLEPVLTEHGYVDSYDLHYLGWERAVLGRETVPRFDPTIPLGDRPYDFLRGESVRMQFGEGMANAVSALPETAFMVGQGGKIVVGAAIAAGDPSGLVKTFGAGLVLGGLDELKGYACGTDPYFVQGLKGLGLDERDIARVQFVKGAGQAVVLLAYALPSAHRPLSMGSPQLTASSPEFLEYMAIRQQGYTASQALELMKQFRAGANPGNAWAFHFTDVKHGVGIIEDVQLNAGYGIRGSGVYAGDTPTPSFALKHTPYAGWGLGRTPVRIPIQIRPNMSILRTRIPPRTIIITTDVPFEGN